jgi:glycosyltransferase involved in cell wall biosynthesis
VLPTRRPRILHCVSHLGLGGAERVALNIMEQLSSEFDFSVFAIRGVSDGEAGQRLVDDLRQSATPFRCGLRVPMRFGGMITGAIGLALAIRRFDPDIIHLHSEIPEVSCAIMLAVLPGFARRPLIRTIHNSNIWGFSPRLGYWCDRRLAHAHCIAVSKSAVEAILKLRRESGAPTLTEPPVLIYNAVSPLTTIFGREPALPGDPIRVLFGGRFEYEKGADLLPEILRQTPLPVGQTAELSIFGSGEFHDALNTLSQSPPTGWTVKLNPPNPHFREQLTNYDLVLMPSRFEGLPLVALEAAMADLPIIATDAPGLREALPPEHRWLARPDDANNFASHLSRALSQPESWAEVAHTTRKFVERKFDTATMSAAHEKMYRRLTSTRESDRSSKRAPRDSAASADKPSA